MHWIRWSTNSKNFMKCRYCGLTVFLCCRYVVSLLLVEYRTSHVHIRPQTKTLSVFNDLFWSFRCVCWRNAPIGKIVNMQLTSKISYMRALLRCSSIMQKDLARLLVLVIRRFYCPAVLLPYLAYSLVLAVIFMTIYFHSYTKRLKYSTKWVTSNSRG